MLLIYLFRSPFKWIPTIQNTTEKSFSEITNEAAFEAKIAQIGGSTSGGMFKFNKNPQRFTVTKYVACIFSVIF